MKSKINEFIKETSTNDPNHYLLLPSKYNRRDFPSMRKLKPLKFNKKSYTSEDYELRNTLAVHIPGDSNNKEFTKAFTKFLRKSHEARMILQKDGELKPINNSKTVTTSRCTFIDSLRESKNSYKSMIATLYNQINCGNGGFGGFDFSSFLTNFFEVGKRKVYVSDSTKFAHDENGNKLTVLSNSEADKLTDEEVKNESINELNTDIVKWLETLTIDKIGDFPKIIDNLMKKIGADKGSLDIAEVIDDIIKNSKSFDKKYLQSTLQTAFTLFSGVGTAVKKVRDKNILDDSFLKDTDFLSQIIDSMSSSFETLIQKILFEDEGYNTFFSDTGYDSYKKYVQIKIKQAELTLETNNSSKAEAALKVLDEAKAEKVSIDEKLTDIAKGSDYTNYIGKVNELAKLESDVEELGLKIDELNNVIIRQETLKEMDDPDYDEVEHKQYKSDKERALSSEIEKGVKIRLLEEEIIPLKEQKFFKDYSDLTSKYKAINKEIEQKEINYKKMSQLYNSSKNSLLSLKKELETLEGYKNSSSKFSYVKEIGTEKAITLFGGLVTNTVYTLLENLNLGKFDENRSFEMTGFNFSVENLDIIRPLFHDKKSMNGLNKIIQFINSLVGKFNKDALFSASKFIYNVIPTEALDFLTNEIDLGITTINFKDGIDIGPELTYGIATSAGIVVGTGLGAGIGAGVGALFAGKKGAKIGALAGAGIGSLAGAGATAGTVYHYFNDGIIKLDKPSDVLVELIEDIKKAKKANISTSFNFFTDGHTFLKNTYLEGLNKVFVNLSKAFLYGEETEGYLYDEIEELKTKYSDETFSPWNMTGEVLKTFMISPQTLRKIFEGSSYTNVNGVGLFKEEVVKKIREASLFSTDSLKELTKSTNQSYLNDLNKLQEKVLDWFLNSSLLTNENTQTNEYGTEKIRIGYNPKNTSKEMLQKLVEEFRKLNSNITNKVEFVEYDDEYINKVSSGEIKDNTRDFTFRIDYRYYADNEVQESTKDENGESTWDKMLKFNKETEESSKDEMIENEEIKDIPIMETRFIAWAKTTNKAFKNPNPSNINSISN